MSLYQETVPKRSYKQENFVQKLKIILNFPSIRVIYVPPSSFS